MMTENAKSTTFTPFRYSVFTVLWTAALFSNIGGWMSNLASGWVMTDLSHSHLMVSLVQTATTLPIFLFALPAGALGDIFNSRKLLIVTQIFATFVASALTIMFWMGLINPWNLLLFTFLTGMGGAFSMPVWQSIVPQVIPKEVLPSAIVLNGVGINISRAIGSAFGGIILAHSGATVTFGIDAFSDLFIIAALIWWRPAVKVSSSIPREHWAGAMQAGINFALRTKPLIYTFIRSLSFIPFTAAYLALLPLVVKDILKGNAALYGVLLTTIGIGSVLGTFGLRGIKNRLGPNKTMIWAVIGNSLSLFLFAYGDRIWVAIIASLIVGASGIMGLTTLQVSAQVALPSWVRTRGVAVNMIIFMGGLTVGSVVWGKLAELIGLSPTLIVSATIALFLIPFTNRYQLNLGENQDYEPSGHWPEPVLAITAIDDSGPVLVTIEYLINDSDRIQFLELIPQLGNIRRRDGAFQWGYFEDVEHQGRFIEILLVESWAEHLRQHTRISQSDKILQDKINALHQGSDSPKVTHSITPRNEAKTEKIPNDHVD